MQIYKAVKMREPSFLHKNSPEYNSEDVAKFGPFYVYKKKEVYTDASLFINKTDGSYGFEWRIMVKFSYDKFSNLLDKSLDSSNKIIKIKGKLYSPILFYEIIGAVEVDIKIDLSPEKRPLIIILEHSGELYNDFINGISEEKYLGWQKKLNITPFKPSLN